MKKISIILTFFIMYSFANSQTSDISIMSNSECVLRVREANTLFDKGKYENCINLLESVLNTCKLTRSDKLLAMELLAKAYLETDEQGKAEAWVNVMLRNYPHYELDSKNNAEMYNRLVNKFKIHPRFSVGARNTADWVTFKTTKVYTLLDDVDYSVPYQQNLEGILHGFGLMYYGWMEIEFDRGYSINFDLIFKWTKINRNFTRPGIFDLSYWEKDDYIETPVYLKKYFPVGKNLLPYATLGMGWLYMTEAIGNASIYYTGSDLTESTGDISVLSIRNRHNFEWIAGAGVGYKLKNLRLFIDVRYYGGLTSLTNPEAGYDFPILSNEYFYIDNSVKLNQFEIGASVSYTLINSVKRVRH